MCKHFQLSNMYCNCTAPLPPDEIRIERITLISNDYSVSWLKYDNKSHVDGWLLTYNSSEDKGKYKYIPRLENSERISETLRDLKEGQTYTVMVTGKSKGVLSSATTVVIESKM